MKTDWLYCSLVYVGDLYFSHDPFCLGQFEFSRNPEAFKDCEDALSQSASLFGIALNQQMMRMRTFFVDAEQDEPMRHGRLYARETLTLLQYSSALARRPRLLRAGYLMDLATGAVIPFRRTHAESVTSLMGFVGHIDRYATHPTLTINSLLAVNPTHYGELGSALRRSTHWSHLAAESDDYGERLLTQWMACETLTRVHEDEDLRPKLLAAIGFPKGQYWLALPTPEQAELKKMAKFRLWQKRLDKLLDTLRIARNDIAHSGYRELDLRSSFSESDERVVRRALRMSVSGLQRLALNALALGIRGIDDMWRRYGECQMFYRAVSLAREVEGTTIFTLEQPVGVLPEPE